MPFADATALVTVEREGVLAASIVHLSGRDPIITIPVRDWARVDPVRDVFLAPGHRVVAQLPARGELPGEVRRGPARAKR